MVGGPVEFPTDFQYFQSAGTSERRTRVMKQAALDGRDVPAG
jgi:hypothetical protein